MIPHRFPRVSTPRILAARGPKQPVDFHRPLAFFAEPEYSATGQVEPVATIFLANRECPFRCLMCDLWKQTTDVPVPEGAIPRQIAHALARLPAASHIKLYNHGNFFDRQAIPAGDYPAIADLLRPFHTVIVENHPQLCGEDCRRFRDLLAGKLEIALGLETVHEQVLARLNKQMTVGDVQRTVDWLRRQEMGIRVFILLRPPFLSEAEGVEWACRSIETAFSWGVECCSVIPTRAGNGIMEQLQRAGHFAPPELPSLESVVEYGLGLGRGRVLADLWDLERLVACGNCAPARRERLRRMNQLQRVVPPVTCEPCSSLARRTP